MGLLKENYISMGSFRIKEALELFPLAHFKGNPEQVITQVIGIRESLPENYPNTLSWINDKTAAEIEPHQIHLGLLILSEFSYQKLQQAHVNFLIVENPRAAFFQLVEKYFSSIRLPKVEVSARIDETVIVGSNCYIGHNVVIEKNCKIGNNTTILHNTSVLEGTIIGEHVIIGCNNTIGNYGFGYEKNSKGDYFLLQHIGHVVIHDHVEIHNNTCIDRGVLGDTVIHENTKIDNLVHIAHGVVIHRNALVIANAMIAGSALIGENSWIAPSVSIKNKANIAPNTMTGIGAVILKDTERDCTYIGNPATTIEEYKNWSLIKKKVIEEEDRRK